MFPLRSGVVSSPPVGLRGKAQGQEEIKDQLVCGRGRLLRHIPWWRDYGGQVKLFEEVYLGAPYSDGWEAGNQLVPIPVEGTLPM